MTSSETHLIYTKCIKGITRRIRTATHRKELTPKPLLYTIAWANPSYCYNCVERGVNKAPQLADIYGVSRSSIACNGVRSEKTPAAM